MRPCCPSQCSVRPDRSSMLCAAKNSGVARFVVPSSATAFAPFSQNSAAWRWPGSGSGHAQLMQSKPSAWFNLSSVLAVRTAPMWPRARFIETATAVAPAACDLGFSMSSCARSRSFCCLSASGSGMSASYNSESTEESGSGHPDAVPARSLWVQAHTRTMTFTVGRRASFDEWGSCVVPASCAGRTL